MVKQILFIEDVYKKIIHYCNSQERCQQEVQEKLTQFNLKPQESNAILKYLVDHDLVNEERFTKSFTSSRIRYKKWGGKKIAHELILRGVSGVLIEQVWKTVDQEEYKKMLSLLIEIKLEKMSGKFTLRKRERMYRFLLNKGYEDNLIQEAFQKYFPFII
ncbi:MAG: regulatory protein RecX [Flavobacteriales bacterium]